MKQKLKINLIQFNPIVGDIDGNANKILNYIKQSNSDNIISLYVFPEMSLCGYIPEDLLFRKDFKRSINKNVRKIVSNTLKGNYIFLGTPRYEKINKKEKVFNSCLIINNKGIVNYYDKRNLPNYGVFDEKRYFSKGNKKLTIEINGIKIALLICEDVWDKTTISESLSSPSPEICITLNASPFEIGKKNIRSEILKKAAKKYKTNFIYLNIIGGQDEIVFDGSSLIYDKSSQKLMHMDSFKESILTLNYAKKFKVGKNISIIDNKKKQISDIYEAIKLGTKDYILKNNFEGVIIGLSGGIDSALTLAIASDILSKDKILPVLMPSIYTSSLSNKLAMEQCAMLGITPYEIPIIDINKSVKYVISENFLPINNNIAAENIQSRIRGLLLMTLSNETGKVVLSTGNKSELAVGYSTLYGDMSGSFSPLKDLYKTDIYKLSIYRNSFKKAIPEKILKREPSAELNFNQKDTDSLPSYDKLDKILKSFIEKRMSVDDITNLGFERKLVKEIINKVIKNEFKRRQSAPGVKIYPESFGKDRRFPIVSKFKF
ncbi:MAG: NAD+ synthase [Pseudomonadota bacterium]|nr:NAD+ synthase [Pseudomonadota bacterium]